jgi:CubicO group peptidase (beta-lactamase class C family)
MLRLSTASRRGTSAAVLAALLLGGAPTGTVGSTSSAYGEGLDPAALARFEARLEELRRQLKIPGLSVAVVGDNGRVWARGLGLADRGRGIPASPHTPYHLASVTKPWAAVLVLQLVEEGALGLDDPVSEYGLDYEGPGVIRVRHLLSHTSRGQPGAEFLYDSQRFADLGWLIARASGRSFRELLVERIVEPLGLADTAPTPLSMGDGPLEPFRIWLDPRNTRVYRRVARPYALDGSFRVVDGHHPILFSPASGLISSVSDLARLDTALDENRLLSPASTARMYAPTVTSDGRELPYGIGWFSQRHRGTRLVWHYGWNPPTASALYLKVPDEGLTFIALANTDALSRPFDLGPSTSLVLDSAVALAFYETFVLEARRGRRLPRVDWHAGEESLVARLQGTLGSEMAEVRERELLSHRRLFHAMGRVDAVARLETVHRRVYPQALSVGEEALPALGPHLLPWSSLPLFGMGHVAALVWFLLVLAATLVLRTVRTVLRRARGRPPIARSADGLLIGSSASVVLGGAVLYVAALARWPQGGAFTWSDGSLLVRSLLAVAAVGGVVASAVVIRAVTRCGDRRRPILGRLGALVVASGVGVGSWALLDLVGWL